MPHDFHFAGRESFGEWLNRQMHEAVAFEDAPWAIERARRVEGRLQANRPETNRLIVEIPWLQEITAFTAPGRYIYFSRRLFEVCATDEQVAFVISHEIAHHDLGHVALFRGWTDTMTHFPGATIFATLFRGFERLVYGPQNECDADRYGIDLCVKAGYDGGRCLELFDILEQRCLDVGDLDMVYGPDVESDDELDPKAPWTTKAKIWAWQKTRGYLPIRDRRQMLRKHLQQQLV